MPDRHAHARSRTNVSAAVGLTMVLAVLPASAPESPVADAAQRRDIESVRGLLRQGADVNAAQGDGMTALHWAALADDPAMAGVLIYAGANLESTTRLGAYTPLHLASKEARSRAAIALIEAGARVDAQTSTGVYPIHFAAQAGQPEILGALLQHGADPNARESYSERTPLMFATANNRLDAVRVLLANGADLTLASEVVDYGEREKEDGVERRRRARLVAAAREPQERQERPERPATPDTAATVPDSVAKSTPDTAAAHAAEPELPARQRQQRQERTAVAIPDPDSPTLPDTSQATAAATAQPDSNAPPPKSYSEIVGKQGGMTALHYAARDGRMEAARMLLAAGADVNDVTKGDESSPLLISIINGNYDLAMYLLEQGADPNMLSEDDAGPLFATLNNEWALRTWYPQPTANKQQKTSYLELMRALLEAGAEPNVRVETHIWYTAYNAGRMGVDFSGATPFWRAAYATDVEAMRLLIEFGADPNIPTIKPPSRRSQGFPLLPRPDSTENETDPSGLPPVPDGGPAVHPLHAASGVGYGTSRVGQQHRHVPDGWLPAVQYLVDSLGVDVNGRDHDGYTAMHNAAARGDNAMIEYLIEKGADVTLVSRRGQTTVDMANGPQQRVQPFPETIALLERHGGINNNKCQSCE